MLLCLVHCRQGLIGGKDNTEPLGAFSRLKTPRNIRALSRDGNFQVIDRNVFGFLGYLRIRTHREGAHIEAPLRRPFLQRLRKQRDRRNQEQDARLASPIFGHALCEAQRSKRLAGTASHDELAAVMRLKSLDGPVDSRLLVRARLEGLALREVDLNVFILHLGAWKGDVPG